MLTRASTIANTAALMNPPVENPSTRLSVIRITITEIINDTSPRVRILIGSVRRRNSDQITPLTRASTTATTIAVQ